MVIVMVTTSISSHLISSHLISSHLIPHSLPSIPLQSPFLSHSPPVTRSSWRPRHHGPLISAPRSVCLSAIVIGDTSMKRRFNIALAHRLVLVGTMRIYSPSILLSFHPSILGPRANTALPLRAPLFSDNTITIDDQPSSLPSIHPSTIHPSPRGVASKQHHHRNHITSSPLLTALHCARPSPLLPSLAQLPLPSPFPFPSPFQPPSLPLPARHKPAISLPPLPDMSVPASARIIGVSGALEHLHPHELTDRFRARLLEGCALGCGLVWAGLGRGWARLGWAGGCTHPPGGRSSCPVCCVLCVHGCALSYVYVCRWLAELCALQEEKKGKINCGVDWIGF